MLKTLGSNQTLDFGGLGVWLLTLTLWLNLTTNDEFADLNLSRTSSAICNFSHSIQRLPLAATFPKLGEDEELEEGV